jgi:hypothetical protein
MEDPSGDAAPGKQGGTENDDGQIVDRGKGQSFFQIVLGKGQHPGQKNRKGSHVGERKPQIQVNKKVRPEDIEDDPEDTEDPCLNHGDGMEQGTDRSRSDHGRGQPFMEGHQGGFGAESQNEGDEKEAEQAV